MKALIKELTETSCPSGNEDRIRELIIKRLSHMLIR